jgi:tetratricopeptide (TPR) repeat protein
MLARILAIIPLAAMISNAADPPWIKMKSPNFELYTTAGESSGQSVLVQFERVRSYFQQALARPPKNPLPIRIVLFKSEKEFAPYKPNESGIAFYQPGRDADLIVMYAGGPDLIAIHEYVHVLISHTGDKIPVWLNEGLADLYSTIEQTGKQVIIGRPPDYRMQLLRSVNWVPLDQVLRVDHDSAHYNEKEKAGLFYAESWMLVHMLMLTPEFRPKFGELVEKLASGTSSIEALEQTYGLPIAKLHTRLEMYARRSDLAGGLANIKIDPGTEKPVIAAATPFETGMLLADVLAVGSKRRAQAKLAYEKLAAANPTAPEPSEALGYLAWREDKTEEARKYFAQAIKAGTKNTKILLEHAKLQRAAGDADYAATLNYLTAIAPDHTEAWMMLATERYSKRLWVQALAALLQVKKVTPEQAGPLFRMLAHSHAMANQKPQAIEAAERLRALAKTPAEIDDAERLLRFTRQPDTLSEPAVQVEEKTPELEEAEEVDFLPPKQPTVSAKGKFIQLECLGAEAKVILLSGTTRLEFLIADPTSIDIKGADGAAAVDLQCGQQKQQEISIEYVPKADAKQGTIGVVRVLEFR